MKKRLGGIFVTPHVREGSLKRTQLFRSVGILRCALDDGHRGLRIFFMIGITLLYSNVSIAQLRDPTQPVEKPVKQVTHVSNRPGFNVQSILITSNRSLATINGKLVGIGSTIDGARVVAIDKNRVTLSNAGHTDVVHLFKGIFGTARE